MQNLHPARLLMLLTCLAMGACAPRLADQGMWAEPAPGTLVDGLGQSSAVAPTELSHTGLGLYVWPNGERYEGVFVAGQPHGLGSMIAKDAAHYSGFWHQGRRQGHGMLGALAGKGVYMGTFHSDQRLGVGRFYSTNGSYNGSWQNDLPHGYGSFVYGNGSIYVGSWNQGMRSGRGVLLYPDGKEYRGEWRNNKPDGFGEELDKGGAWYNGGWRSGTRNGYGDSLEVDGTVYVGTWKSGYRSGFGVETSIDGNRYEGDWATGKRNGEGTVQRINGDQHSGRWRDDRPAGQGVRTLADGSRIGGEWRGDFIATGRVTLPSGASYQGPIMAPGRQAEVQGPLTPDLRAWLERQVASGNGNAMVLLARSLSWGGVEIPEQSHARIQTLLRQAADLGIRDAGYLLAVHLLRTADDPQNVAGPLLQLLENLAGEGHPGANAILGRLLLDRDPGQVTNYLRAAAERGHIGARSLLAWLLATSSNTAIRDAERAMLLARPLAHFAPSADHIDILAAAYAANGDFLSAAAAQRHAIALAQQHDHGPTNLEKMRSRLESYLQRKDWYE